MLARHLNETGEHDAVHPRDRGRLGELDHVVLARCIAEDRVIVTENAVDFRKLLVRQALHPGLIVLPSVSRDHSLRLIDGAIVYLASLGDPPNLMVNHVLEVNDSGELTLSSLPG